MSDKRNCFLYCAVGKKASGKTYTTTNSVLKPYAFGKNPKRVLILDVNGEYTQFPTISLENVQKFSVHPKKEIRRIVPPHGMSLDDIARLLFDILKVYRNGILMIEDLNVYLGDHMPSDLIGTIVRLRHNAVDIILHFQNIGRVGHPKVLGNMNILRIHKTIDDVDRHKNKFEDQYTIVKIAQSIVDNDFRKANIDSNDKSVLGIWANLGDSNAKEYKSCYVYVHFDKNKITGSFNKTHFDEAVMDYINNNEATTIKPLLNKKDSKGRKMYNYETALKACLHSFYIEFYGNSDRNLKI